MSPCPFVPKLQACCPLLRKRFYLIHFMGYIIHRFLVVWTAFGRQDSFPNCIWERNCQQSCTLHPWPFYVGSLFALILCKKKLNFKSKCVPKFNFGTRRKVKTEIGQNSCLVYYTVQSRSGRERRRLASSSLINVSFSGSSSSFRPSSQDSAAAWQAIWECRLLKQQVF